MNNKIFFGVLILAAGVLAGWFLLKENPTSQNLTGTENIEEVTSPASKTGQNNASDPASTGSSEESMEKGGSQTRMVVTYTDSGFAPQPLTIKKGTTVTFVNESGRGMWVASAMHPTHQLLPGFDQLSAATKGGAYEYIFVQVGTWKYHNHVNPADTGSVVVTL